MLNEYGYEYDEFFDDPSCLESDEFEYDADNITNDLQGKLNVLRKDGYNDSDIISAVHQDNSIIITPKAVGTARVTLVTAATSQYHECQASFNVTVTPLPLNLTWSASEFNYDGTEKRVTAVVNNIVGNDEITLQ